MAYIFRDTGLGNCLKILTKRTCDKEPPSPSPFGSQNYRLSLKLESQRIVADVKGVHNDSRSDNDAASMQCDNSLVLSKREASDDEVGWDGPLDPVVHSPVHSLGELPWPEHYLWLI